MFLIFFEHKQTVISQSVIIIALNFSSRSRNIGPVHKVAKLSFIDFLSPGPRSKHPASFFKSFACLVQIYFHLCQPIDIVIYFLNHFQYIVIEIITLLSFIDIKVIVVNIFLSYLQ